ncbi:bhlh transcription factor [Dorcoceras hygrometricum]|uniref:Bhlh transcription factor n=1 Tax=Dorcoceras hygrometricum TaxID=472368 RepID=A0A2Z7D872_9LAMI|nr:bhlh transcription factor [Dorcoceras hygrometricum]
MSTRVNAPVACGCFWKDFTREKSADGFRRPAGGRFDDVSGATCWRQWRIRIRFPGGPRPQTRLLRQPALEGLMNLARTEAPRRGDRNKSDHVNGGGTGRRKAAADWGVWERREAASCSPYWDLTPCPSGAWLFSLLCCFQETQVLQLVVVLVQLVVPQEVVRVSQWRIAYLYVSVFLSRGMPCALSLYPVVGV